MPDLVLETTSAVVLELEVGTPGPPGHDGADGTGGGGAGVTNTYIQLAEPTPANGSGPFIWYQLNALGAVIDIRKGVA